MFLMDKKLTSFLSSCMCGYACLSARHYKITFLRGSSKAQDIFFWLFRVLLKDYLDIICETSKKIFFFKKLRQFWFLNFFEILGSVPMIFG